MIPAIAGAVGVGAMSLFGQERANVANRAMAREQMAFQERMSGTSYQRAVEDMKLAGINPMLAYAQGGASSPGGQTARMEDVLGPAASSAMSMMRMKKELKVMEAQAYKLESEGHVADVTAKIANYGVSLPDSTGRKRHVPYGALSRRAQFGLTQAQADALRFSPFMTKFTGVSGPRKFFEDYRENIKFRDKYQRRP